MNIEVDRNLLAQVAIILCLTIGGWLKVVEPSMADIRKLEAEMETRRAESPPVKAALVDAMAARLRTAHTRVAEIRRRNEIARNTTQLYGRIKSLADEHDVEVRHLQPGGDRRVDDEEGLISNRLDITVQGHYEAVARFIDEVNAIEGFIRPAFLKLSSQLEKGEGFVRAQYACDVLEFALKGPLAELGGGVEP